VWTLDPISPDNVPGWPGFLAEFNEFCVKRGGIPLLNQTPHLTRAQVSSAFGARLATVEATRQKYDPSGRMLNWYFDDLLAPEKPAAPTAP
jgi:hypothetical protein